MDRVTGYLKYTTRAGDTFDALALTMYNDERLADRIIRFSSYLFYHNSAGIQSVFYKVSTNYQYLYR